LIAISAFEILDAIVAIRVIGQIELFGEHLAALMAYKRFLARVEAIVIIEITLIIGRVIALIASVPLPTIHLRPLAFLVVFEDLFALDIEYR